MRRGKFVGRTLAQVPTAYLEYLLNNGREEYMLNVVSAVLNNRARWAKRKRGPVARQPELTPEERAEYDQLAREIMALQNEGRDPAPH